MKACKDCKWCGKYENTFPPDVKCKQEKSHIQTGINYVYGWIDYRWTEAMKMREDESLCGPDAKLFEPKEEE